MKSSGLKYSLSECKAVFHKSFHLEDDHLIDVAAAVYVANLLGADPLWFMIIGPPSNTKTEILQCFAGHQQAVFLSTLTPNTLVSGFKTKDGFNPSLLPKLKDKLLVLKDFTSVLSMRQESRTEVIGQLREAYDGKYDKGYGNGVTINWEGKFVDPEKLDFRCKRPSPLFFETIEASRKFGAKSLLPTAAACGSSSQRRLGWH
jgi:hypothetical protein